MTADLPPMARRAAWLGALVLAVTAVCSDGVHHADEHYQILEFAGWKLGITPEADLPWEFAARMRPALQPAVAVAVHRACALFGTPDPFTVAMLLRLLAAGLSFSAALALLRSQLRERALLRQEGWLRLYLFLAFFLWFSAYCGVRFSSEGLSASLFALGYARVAHHRPAAGHWPMLWPGVLLGLAVVARFQVGIMVAGLLAWLLLMARARGAVIAVLAAGCAIGFGAGIVTDRWFYGEWVLAAWNYIDLNILQGKASEFGTEPWWHYFTELFVRMVPPFSLLILAPPLVFLALRRRDPLTWSVAPFLIAHMAIAHKEYRFLFPLIPLLPALVVSGLGLMQERGWLRWAGSRMRSWGARLFLGVHLPMLLVVMLKPAQDDIGFYRALHREARPGDVLLHEDDDPYRQGLPVWYHRPRGLRIASINATGQHREGRLFFASRARGGVLPEGMEAKLVYSAFPAWLVRFNVGGWADRSAHWRLWEITAWQTASGAG